eukprot:6195134-Pleurochrysis_carterae.AAC.7
MRTRLGWMGLGGSGVEGKVEEREKGNILQRKSYMPRSQTGQKYKTQTRKQPYGSNGRGSIQKQTR